MKLLSWLVTIVMMLVVSIDVAAVSNPLVAQEYGKAKTLLIAELKALGMALLAVLAALVELALLIGTLGLVPKVAGKPIHAFVRRQGARAKILSRRADRLLAARQ